MNKEFVMRGQTNSGETETLNFSGYKPGYAYRLVEFQLFPSTGIGSAQVEISGTVTAGKTAVAPTDPNFNNEGLLATSLFDQSDTATRSAGPLTIVNDMFLITQNLILMVQETGGTPVNWQCRFIAEKMNDAENAVANYRQFTISDE